MYTAVAKLMMKKKLTILRVCMFYLCCMSLFCVEHNFLNRKFQRKTNCGRIKYVRHTPNDYSIVAFALHIHLYTQ